MSFNLGDVVPLSVTITDADGQPANAGSVTVTVTLPDGTTASPDVSNPEIGVYNADYPTTQAGVHQVRWVATGENASAFEDAFSVASATGLNFISLAETKTHLRKDLTKTTDDAELLAFITAACSKIVELIGPVAPQSIVQAPVPVHPNDVVVLDYHPVIEVTTVTVDAPDGEEIPEADLSAGVQGWVLDGDAGLLRHTRRWPCHAIQVVYRAGRTPLPGNIRLAALELVAHLWKTIKPLGAGNRPTVGGSDDIVIVGQAYALPNRVRELLGLGKNPTADVLVG
jgi:hypothetical protein